MNWYRSEEEVDKLIEAMMKRGKGSHITQSVVFNKSNPRQMKLLKMILMSTESFSGYVKNLATNQFKNIQLPSEINGIYKEETYRIQEPIQDTIIDIYEPPREVLDDSLRDVQNISKDFKYEQQEALSISKQVKEEDEKHQNSSEEVKSSLSKSWGITSFKA